jgi:uncharacterized damage-inducible protein DinB
MRALLARYQDYADAHLTLDAALDDLPPELRGVRPDGLPHSIWELVEHIRVAQRDILDFCVAAEYRHPAWPDAYWPESPAPPAAAWDASLAALRADREALRRLALDESVDLHAVVRHGDQPTQTYLRALLLAQDHAAYHIGQIVAVKQLLLGRER